MVPYSEQLCPSLHMKMSKDACRFGDQCRYQHDVVRYLATKPPDLGEHCYMFETYGACLYGLACRYASSHIYDGKNVINEKLVNVRKVPHVANVIDKCLQEQLRKKQMKFPRTESCLHQLARTEKRRAACETVAENAQSVNTEAKVIKMDTVDSSVKELPSTVDNCSGKMSPTSVKHIPNSTKIPSTDWAHPEVSKDMQKCPELLSVCSGEDISPYLEQHGSDACIAGNQVCCGLPEKRKVRCSNNDV